MLIPQAYAQAAGQPSQGGGLFLPLMMVGILLFMYFTTIRPQSCLLYTLTLPTTNSV